MHGDSFHGEDNEFDWNSEDEREIENFTASSCSSLTIPSGEAVASSAEASSSAGSSGSKMIDHFIGMGFSERMVAEAIQEHGEENANLILETLLTYSERSSASSSGTKIIDHFVGMGFSEKMVAKAIQENGEENMDLILETLLTYSAIEEPPQKQANADSDNFSSECEGSFLDDFSDTDSFESEDITIFGSGGDDSLRSLIRMGYSPEDASIAIQRCGPDATIADLTEFIDVAQMAKAEDASFSADKPKPKNLDCGNSKQKKRSMLEYDMWKRKKQRLGDGFLDGDDEPLRLPNPMIGFGVPNELALVTQRSLPQAAIGPPYFYYENVALAPKGVWQTISLHLFEVEPEFVDSKYFCAAARKRGYVHNLPINNRYPLLPIPAHTIHEALPLTRRWWPSWDTRTQLNCLQTCVGSAKLTEKIRKAVEEYEGEPPLSVQKFVLDQCRKWNLVWVGRNKVAPLEPDEVEMLLGFPRNHTRGGGISRTDRYKSLGNSFQVDTVAYHLSVLKDLFPDGLNLLSLFSGIGGAEVALHRLGIRLKTVVSVEISEVNRNILRCWWEQTNQTGNLIDIPDIQQLDAERLEELMNAFGAFDLVVGGSPCNNLAGSNRHHRDGLDGKESSLFYDYCRVLNLVMSMAARHF
uniref:DNA (cytosine-5-)-methyltransferase n=2 Tax=Rhizophora mucronata TaxID=61149 RepID=A0A2P2KN91_RHIMU